MLVFIGLPRGSVLVAAYFPFFCQVCDGTFGLNELHVETLVCRSLGHVGEERRGKLALLLLLNNITPRNKESGIIELTCIWYYSICAQCLLRNET